MLVTPNPTIGTWFERFMRGNKNQTRSIKIQSFGLSGEVAHTVLEYLEEYWVRIKPYYQKKKIKDMVMFVIMEYWGGLIEEYSMLLLLKVILYFWEETRQHKTPQMMLTLKESFEVET